MSENLNSQNDQQQFNAIVIGSTGAVGIALIKALNTNPKIRNIHSVARRVLSEQEAIQHPKFSQEIVDFEKLSQLKLPAKFGPSDEFSLPLLAFCCLGTTIKEAKTLTAFKKIDVDYPFLFAQRMKELGAIHFSLVSSVGASSKAWGNYLQAKAEAETKIKNLDFTSLHFIRPSFLIAKRVKPRPFEKIAMQAMTLLQQCLPKTLAPYQALPVETVAQAMSSLSTGPRPASLQRSGAISVFGPEELAPFANPSV